MVSKTESESKKHKTKKTVLHNKKVKITVDKKPKKKGIKKIQAQEQSVHININAGGSGGSKTTSHSKTTTLNKDKKNVPPKNDFMPLYNLLLQNQNRNTPIAPPIVQQPIIPPNFQFPK
jgi:hypothetical protein